MQMTHNDYLNVLFDADDHVNACFDSVKETQSYLRGEWDSSPQWVCCNALGPGGTRAQRNLTKLRNFVIEFDGLDVEDQLHEIYQLGIPFSTIVYSGNKSLHAVISLETPLNLADYKSIARKLKVICDKADPACLEPARLTRYPREDQPLLEVKGRVANVDFFRWISSFGLDNLDREHNARKRKYEQRHGELTRTAKRYLAGLSKREQAHTDSLVAAKNLFDMGYSKQDVLDIMTNARQTYMSEPYIISRSKVTGLVEWVMDNWDDEQER